MTTAKDLIDQLVELRAERDGLDAREEFLKDQLQGAISLGELDGYQTDDGVYEFDNAKYIRSQRNTYKLSKDAEKAIRTIKEQDIDAGLAKRNVTVFYQLRITS
jgi:hypothetical protein